MRTLLLLLAIATASGCRPRGGAGGYVSHPAPAGKHAYADKAIQDHIATKLNAGSINTSLVAWGPNWEATPSQLRAMETRGGKAFFPTALYIDTATHSTVLPAVAFAQEARVRRIPKDNPGYPNEETLLFLFGTKGNLLTFVGLDFMPAGKGPGKWMGSLPPG